MFLLPISYDGYKNTKRRLSDLIAAMKYYLSVFFASVFCTATYANYRGTVPRKWLHRGAIKFLLERFV